MMPQSIDVTPSFEGLAAYAPMSTPEAAPLRCLIAEDQGLIGLALEAYVEEMGYATAGPFASCGDALAWLEHDTPDCAILDYKLRDGACLVLAQTLRERGVPFIIYSGFRRQPDMPAELQDVTWLEKPTDRATVLRELGALTRRAVAIPRYVP